MQQSFSEKKRQEEQSFNFSKQYAKSFQPLPQIAEIGKTHKQVIDTNVVSIKLNILSQEATLATGDPVKCKSCQSFLNVYSKIKGTSNQDVYEWDCEFCESISIIQLEQEGIPQPEQLTYILESHQQVIDRSQDDISGLLVIDVSGPMGVTQAVKEQIKLRVDPLAELRKLQNAQDGPQFLLGQRNYTYISRLQCVQAAIDKQLENMTQTNPNRHVGIISFSGEVQIIGDGTQVP